LIVICFAEVSSRFKDTGGLYLFARTTFGPLVGFEIGWLSWLTRTTSFAALSNLFADYLSYFLPGTATGLGRTTVIVLIVCALTVVNVAGVRLATLCGNTFTLGKILPLIFLVVCGFFYVNPQRFALPPFPGYAPFSASVFLLLFAFTGFEVAVIPAGEARDPKRHLPFALIVGMAMVVLLYVAIQAICIGVLPELAESQRPLADAGSRIFGGFGAALISLGALISVTGTLNAIMLAAPRLLFAMAEHQQIPRIFSSTHSRFNTPHVAIFVSSAAMLALSLSGTFASAAISSTVIRLTTYAATCAALPVLRRRKLGEAAFEVPGGNIVAIAALILIVWLYSSNSWAEAQTVLLASALGLVLYGAYSRWRPGSNSLQRQL
jgi:amino acid transporter